MLFAHLKRILGLGGLAVLEGGQGFGDLNLPADRRGRTPQLKRNCAQRLLGAQPARYLKITHSGRAAPLFLDLHSGKARLSIAE
jgi:hypothetical protein